MTTRPSGYSPFGTTNPGGRIPAFFNSFPGKVREGMCDGAVLRARQNNSNKIETFSWGYRNGYAIRFAPDVLQLARQNKDGTPDYHGWPARFGFLPSSRAVFNPIGGPSDDDCNPPGPKCVPIKNGLAHPPLQPGQECPAVAEVPEFRPQRHRRPGVYRPQAHRRVQPPDQHPVRSGRLRLYRRLRRGAARRGTPAPTPILSIRPTRCSSRSQAPA